MSERLLIDLEKANNDIKSLNSELKTDFNVNWTDKEQKELIAIDAEYEKAKAEFNAFSIEYNKVIIYRFKLFIVGNSNWGLEK